MTLNINCHKCDKSTDRHIYMVALSNLHGVDGYYCRECAKEYSTVSGEHRDCQSCNNAKGTMYIHDLSIKSDKKVFFCSDCYWKFIGKYEERKKNFEKYGQPNMGNLYPDNPVHSKHVMQIYDMESDIDDSNRELQRLRDIHAEKDRIAQIESDIQHKVNHLKKVNSMRYYESKTELEKIKDLLNDYYRNIHFKPLNYDIIKSVYQEHGTFI